MKLNGITSQTERESMGLLPKRKVSMGFGSNQDELYYMDHSVLELTNSTRENYYDDSVKRWKLKIKSAWDNDNLIVVIQYKTGFDEAFPEFRDFLEKSYRDPYNDLRLYPIKKESAYRDEHYWYIELSDVAKQLYIIKLVQSLVSKISDEKSLSYWCNSAQCRKSMSVMDYFQKTFRMEKCYVLTGDVGEAMKRLSAMSPHDNQANWKLLEYAKMAEDNGNVEQAIDFYNAVHPSFPDIRYRAQKRVFELCLEHGDHDDPDYLKELIRILQPIARASDKPLLNRLFQQFMGDSPLNDVQYDLGEGDLLDIIFKLVESMKK